MYTFFCLRFFPHRLALSIFKPFALAAVTVIREKYAHAGMQDMKHHMWSLMCMPTARLIRELLRQFCQLTSRAASRPRAPCPLFWTISMRKQCHRTDSEFMFPRMHQYTVKCVWIVMQLSLLALWCFSAMACTAAMYCLLV